MSHTLAHAQKKIVCCIMQASLGVSFMNNYDNAHINGNTGIIEL